MINRVVIDSTEKTPQGGFLSPLLSNIILKEDLDLFVTLMIVIFTLEEHEQEKE